MISPLKAEELVADLSRRPDRSRVLVVLIKKHCLGGMEAAKRTSAFLFSLTPSPVIAATSVSARTRTKKKYRKADEYYEHFYQRAKCFLGPFPISGRISKQGLIPGKRRK